MAHLKENLLIQFSLLSIVLMVLIGLGLASLLTNRLDHNHELLIEHGAAMMSGAMIKPSDPYSIQSLTSDVDALRNLTYAAVGVGFAVLYGSLFGVVWRGWRTITAQRAQLQGSNEDLTSRVEQRVQELRDSNEQLRYQIHERERTEEELRQTNLRLEAALEELRETQQQIAQQERLRALGQMASGIAHDFNNALSPILTYSSTLLESPDSLDNKAQLIDDLRVIHSATQDAAEVVKRLGEFYRGSGDGDEAQELDLNEQVRRVVQLTRPTWMGQSRARGITIDVETDLAEITPIGGYEAQIREALTNLVLNAVDAMPDGGTISVRTGADDGFAVLEISDTGVGMPAEVLARCLDPFFSTKGDLGTGMGLAMVHGIVQRHRGEYEIKSEVGKGSTFVIRLPFYQDTGEPKHTETVSDRRLDHSLHMLIVDDDAMGLRALQRLLATDGHTFDAATTGQDGLNRFQGAEFDVVVTDRAMPEMNGDQLAAAIREIAPDQPIIMITGFGDIMATSHETPPNVDLVVSKPIDPNAFREALLDVLEIT